VGTARGFPRGYDTSFAGSMAADILRSATTPKALTAALHTAASQGHASIVTALLADGRADPAADDSAMLRMAVRLNHLGVVQALLADGRADPAACNSIVLADAAHTGARAHIVRALLEDGRADPRADGSYALRVAAVCRDTDAMVALLTDGRADPAADDEYALRAAARCGYVNIVSALLADGRLDPSAVARAHADAHFDYAGVGTVKRCLVRHLRWLQRRRWLRVSGGGGVV
jgi:hypothetical protein